MAGSFFDARSTGTRQTDAAVGPVAQLLEQLTPAPADGVYVHSRDLREQCVAAMPMPHRLEGRVQTTLLFIEAAEKQVDMLVQLFDRQIAGAPARRTLTFVYSCVMHSVQSHSVDSEPLSAHPRESAKLFLHGFLRLRSRRRSVRQRIVTRRGRPRA